MEQVASETEHSREVVHWAEQQQRHNYQQQQQKLMSAKDGMTARESEVEREKRLAELYRQGVENSGVRVVQGDTLSVHHQLANFWQENPFKILAAMAGEFFMHQTKYSLKNLIFSFLLLSQI